MPVVVLPCCGLLPDYFADRGFDFQRLLVNVQNVDQPIVVSSINPAPGIITIDELEVVYFTFTGTDPDGNNLSYHWKRNNQQVSTSNFYLFQTDYNSAGQHQIELAVSDGFSRNDTTFQWTVNVNDVDQEIIVQQLLPAEGLVNITETDTVSFLFNGYDPDGNVLLYEWLLDSLQVSTDSTYTFFTDLKSAGEYTLELNVTDHYSRNEITFSWSIIVAETDQFIIVDSLYPGEFLLEISEMEQVDFYFSGHDPDGNSLLFNYELDSLQVSSDSIYTFITDYGSAGQHEVSLSVTDGFSRNDTTFTWFIDVLDVDRVIVVDSLFPASDNLEIAENDSIEFGFSGYDPDGASLNYTWVLDSVNVSIDSTYTFLTDFNSAGLYTLSLTVSDSFSRNDTMFSWHINVTDVDQEIVVDSLNPLPGPITINEFEQIQFSFSGTDPDGASLNYTWLLDSLLVSTDSTYIFLTNEATAGNHEIVLRVNDGFGSRDLLEYSWQVTVNNVQVLLVPEYFVTIQAAIDAAVNGDTVLVNTGTYPENISFTGKNILVTSYFQSRDATLIDSTIIDGSGIGSVVSINSGEDSTAVLRGFTIMNGNAANGGGVLIENSDPHLRDLYIRGNNASARGGGIYGLNTSSVVYGCKIDSNLAFIGAGVEFKNSSAKLINCEISNNSASFIGGGVETYNSNLQIYNNVIRDNSCTDLNGGGVAAYNNSVLNILHAVVYGNSANSGGGIAINNSTLSLKNSIVSNNLNYGLYFENGSLDVSYSNFWNNSVADFHNCGDTLGVITTENQNGDPCDIYSNIKRDPIFNDPDNKDLSLSELSLCIGAGESAGFLNYDKIMSPRPFPAGTDPDLGAFEHNLGKPVDATPEISEKFPIADTLYIMEADSIFFSASAYDPNGREVFFNWELDSLQVSTDSSYTLNTDYFSAGIYELSLTVSDSTSFARAETSISWSIVVSDVDREIIVNSLYPAPGDSTIIESDSINFVFSGYDPDLNPLIYSWQVDNVEVSADSSFGFSTNFTSAGIYQVSLLVSDGTVGRNNLFYEWEITVSNVTLFTVPELVTTIQGAINVTIDGDTVLVSPGYYIENLNFLGKEITVASHYFTTEDTAYISQTVIDGSSYSNRSLITFITGESATSVLTGFKLINGSGYNGNGGCIRCESSSPLLSNLIISENSSYSGGGIYCSNGAAPQIVDCIIRDNLAFEGAGVHCSSNSSPVFVNCLIYNNSGISRAGAIQCNNSSPSFTHCTITANSSVTGAGFYLSNNSQPVLLNSIVWNNQFNEVIRIDTLSNLTVNYSIIKGEWPGVGSMDIDPLFTDTENNDLTCSNYSYAIGSGDPSAAVDHDLSGAVRPQPAGTNPDLGCYENSLGVPIDGPIIVSQINPSPGPVELNETDSLEFYVNGYDLNGADLGYSWQLAAEEVSTDSNFILVTDFESAGDYFLLLTITDNYPFRGNRSQTGFAWNITVNDVIPLDIPENIVISVSEDSIMICWDPVADAVNYKVYSSDVVDSGFQEDLSGVFNGTCWSALRFEDRKFYRVTAEK